MRALVVLFPPPFSSHLLTLHVYPFWKNVLSDTDTPSQVIRFSYCTIRLQSFRKVVNNQNDIAKILLDWEGR